jgi:hypothetical protein
MRCHSGPRAINLNAVRGGVLTFEADNMALHPANLVVRISAPRGAGFGGL